MSQNVTHPTRAGQAVRDEQGRIGITADWPRKRTPSIEVMFLGANYTVLAQVADLTVITITEKLEPTQEEN